MRLRAGDLILNNALRYQDAVALAQRVRQLEDRQKQETITDAEAPAHQDR